MITLADKIRAADGRTYGFDYLRLLLSVAVVLWHTVVTSYGTAGQDVFQDSVFRPLAALIVPMFFALSGFLVAGSLLRCRTLVMFVGLRSIRIFPALTVEVVLSALLLGPLLTTLPLREYFSSPQFFTYFLNIPGIIQYELPGVFETNPKPRTVNGQLWTIPFELYCYVAITGLGFIGLHRRPQLFLGAALALGTIGALLFLRKQGWSIERRSTGMPGFGLVICFLFGAGFYLVRERLVWSTPLFGVMLLATLALMSVPPLGDILAIVPLTYVTVYLGLCHPRKLWFMQGADYSYGIFLYGYVIQQAWMTLGPPVHHWYWNFLLALPTAAIVAALSWHLVEKPALGWKSHIATLERAWLAAKGRFFAGRKRPPGMAASQDQVR